MKKPGSHGTENQSAKKKGTLFGKRVFKLAMMLGILILSACANQATPQTEANAVSLPQITSTASPEAPQMTPVETAENPIEAEADAPPPSIEVLVEKVPHTMSYMGKDVISQVEEGVYRIDNELTNIHEELRLVELNGQTTLEGVTTGAHYYYVNAKNEWQRLDAFLWHGERTVPGQLLGTPVPIGEGGETVQWVAGEYRGYETVRIGDEQVIVLNLFVGYDPSGQERIMQMKLPAYYGEGNFAFDRLDCVGGIMSQDKETSVGMPKDCRVAGVYLSVGQTRQNASEMAELEELTPGTGVIVDLTTKIPSGREAEFTRYPELERVRAGGQAIKELESGGEITTIPYMFGIWLPN